MASSAFAGGLALAGYGPFPKRDPIAQPSWGDQLTRDFQA